METAIRALILGDVIGHPGCRALFIHAKQLIKDYKADVVIVNGENSADGFGITPDIADQFFSLGIHVITTGNHVWQKRDILGYMDSHPAVLRPANYPPGTPGNGSVTVEVRGARGTVINLQGRDNLSTIDCPFRAARDMIKKMKQDTDFFIIDFHAESVKEKESLAYYLDGSIAAVVGTHTHVQTADERILDGGTAYISDIGMTGPDNSVIGVEPDMALQRSLTQMPLKLQVLDVPAVIHGVLVTIDPATGRALTIERVRCASSL
ncbi:MAG: TIGR00282 family metallophosphoesterase [Spirochaetales bacterium]|nr:TIGR00282 family metallophosphoesterase [Spirochaetales bacterium]